jgi:hypothetical protein
MGMLSSALSIQAHSSQLIPKLYIKANDVTAINQKMSELEISLFNCTQDVLIQRSELPINPEIQQAALKVIIILAVNYSRGAMDPTN